MVKIDENLAYFIDSLYGKYIYNFQLSWTLWISNLEFILITTFLSNRHMDLVVTKCQRINCWVNKALPLSSKAFKIIMT